MLILPQDIIDSLSDLPDSEMEKFCIDAIKEKTKKRKPIKTNTAPSKGKTNTLQIFSDGGSRGNPGIAGAGWIIKQNNQTLIKGKKHLGIATNNQAEYQALLLAINNALKLKPKNIEIFMDSELAVKQLKGEYKVKNVDLRPIYEKILIMLNPYSWKITHIRREKNKEADKLANEAMNQK